MFKHDPKRQMKAGEPRLDKQPPKTEEEEEEDFFFAAGSCPTRSFMIFYKTKTGICVAIVAPLLHQDPVSVFASRFFLSSGTSGRFDRTLFLPSDV